MTKPKTVKKPPSDPNRAAKRVIDSVIASTERDTEPEASEPEKNPAAVALGRLGGLKGGKARAESLSATKRKAIAKKAAKARWSARSDA